ncbi:MAG: DUF3047 domain-containing protein [Candidatus Omnitrophota bacterium]
MRRRVRFYSIAAFIGVMVATGLGFNFFQRGEKAKTGPRQVVKQFSFTSDKSLDEWEEKVLSRNSTDYKVTDDEGKGCIKAVSENSASTLFYRQKCFYTRDPFISWDWKVEKFPDRNGRENLTKKKSFDFAAQLYVVFHARIFLNAKAIQYVWTETLPVGTVAPSPYTKNVMVMVLESGNAGEWKHEERNIREDFRNLFGIELEKDVEAVSFMTDSDSTDSSAVAYYGDIKLGYLAKKEFVSGDAGTGRDLKSSGGNVQVKSRKKGGTPSGI